LAVGIQMQFFRRERGAARANAIRTLAAPVLPGALLMAFWRG
jgi:hypothetical protein